MQLPPLQTLRAEDVESKGSVAFTRWAWTAELLLTVALELTDEEESFMTTEFLNNVDKGVLGPLFYYIVSSFDDELFRRLPPPGVEMAEESHALCDLWYRLHKMRADKVDQ